MRWKTNSHNLDNNDEQVVVKNQGCSSQFRLGHNFLRTILQKNSPCYNLPDINFGSYFNPALSSSPKVRMLISPMQ